MIDDYHFTISNISWTVDAVAAPTARAMGLSSTRIVVREVAERLDQLQTIIEATVPTRT